MYSSCICVSSTDSKRSKWMFVIITLLLFLTLVGIPLAIAIIYKLKKKGLIIALFLYGSNLFCGYIDVSIYREAMQIASLLLDQLPFVPSRLISEFIPKKESQLTCCSAMAVKNKVKKIVIWHLLCVFPSLVPRLRPAFCCLQYRKVGRAWYLFSREHDVISKLRKFAELASCVSRIFNRLRAQRSVCKTITSR